MFRSLANDSVPVYMYVVMWLWSSGHVLKWSCAQVVVVKWLWSSGCGCGHVGMWLWSFLNG